MNLLNRVYFTLAYLGQPPWETGISPPELMDFIQTHSPGRALDLGCGSGTNAITLALNGWQVTGVDFVRRAIHMARRKARQAGVAIDFRWGNVLELKGVSAPFDLILDIGCLHSLGETEKVTYLQNLERLLAPQGFFLLYTFCKSPEYSASGLTEGEIALFMQKLRLIQRVDGSERGLKPSAWFTFQKSPQ